MYERDIVDMATRYGGTAFYEYHKQFSTRTAAHLKYNNIPVDWSIRNNTLFCNIFANQKPITCNRCSSVSHTTGFCPLAATLYTNNSNGTQRSDSRNTDSYGRIRQRYGGQEFVTTIMEKEVAYAQDALISMSASIASRTILGLNALNQKTGKSPRRFNKRGESK